MRGDSTTKIALVCRYFPPEKGGGIAWHVRDLSVSLSNKGVDVSIFTIGNSTLECREKFKVLRSREDCTFLWNFSKLLKNADCDLIHAHGIYHTTTHIASLVSRLIGKPLVTSLHALLRYESVELPFSPPQILLQELTIPVTLSFSRRIVSASSSQFEGLKYKRPFQDRLVKIPNGIDVDAFDPHVNPMEGLRDGRSIVLLYVGYLSILKGAVVLLMALRQILRIYKDLNLVLVGNISVRDRTYIWELARVMNLTKNIKYISYVNRDFLPSIYSAADIFVFPSLWDYFGLVNLEAQACELPVVGSDIGGVKEVIIDGVTGFLVPPNDYRALAHKIMLLIEDRQLRINMGRSARINIVKNYNQDLLVDNFIALYKSIVQGT